MNKYEHCVYVIPEDDANRQIADGFALHRHVDSRRVQVMPPAGGWNYVLTTFQKEYVQKLRDYPKAHVVMLIDFDNCFDVRRVNFENNIPADIKPRVFVVGSKGTPEKLKNSLNKSFEEIGTSLAGDCDTQTTALWEHEELNHNEPDRLRLLQTVRPFLFP